MSSDEGEISDMMERHHNNAMNSGNIMDNSLKHEMIGDYLELLDHV